MSKVSTVPLTDTGETAACHTLGCLIIGYPDACEISNTYSLSHPYRNRDLPGEIAYLVNKYSTESAMRTVGGQPKHEFTAHDILKGYREKPEPGKSSASFAALDAAIDDLKPTDAQRVAVRQALAMALGVTMAAFIRNLHTIAPLWNNAVPHKRTIRKKTGPLKAGESPVEMIIEPILNQS